VTLFKSVTEHCIGDTVCITLHWGVLHVLYKCGNLEIMQRTSQQFKHKQTIKIELWKS